MDSTQDICGMTKGLCRHKETWWWNEEVAEAVREKKIKYGKWKKENTILWSVDSTEGSNFGTCFDSCRKDF